MFLKQAVKIPKPIRETRVAIAKNNPFYWPVHPSGKWLAGKGWCYPYSICLVVVDSFLYILNPKAEVSGLGCSWDKTATRRHQLFRGEFACSRSEGYWRGPEGALHVASNVVCFECLCSAVHRTRFLLICFKSAAGNNSLLLFSNSMVELCLCLCLIVFNFVLWLTTYTKQILCEHLNRPSSSSSSSSSSSCFSRT